MECQARKNSPYTSSKKQMHKWNNMHLAKGITFTDTNYFPILKPYTGPTDFSIFPFNKWKSLSGANQALHFFQYDYRFDNAVWKNLESTTRKLIPFDFLFTPDYSLYVEEYLTQLNKEAIYKTRFVGAYWQNCGFNVIPTVSWGNANSFSYALDGLPTNSVLATCGVGNKHCKSSLSLWKYALQRIDSELTPIKIFVYGEPIEVPYIKAELKFIPDYISTHFRS